CAATASGVQSASSNCAPPSPLWFADAYVERAWIEAAAGADLGTGACGGLPAAGGTDAPISQSLGTLSAAHPDDVLPLSVPAGVGPLRAGVSADSLFVKNFDLYLPRGGPPAPPLLHRKMETARGADFSNVACAPG